MSSTFSVMVFFVCAVFLFHPELRDRVVWKSALLVLGQAEAIMFVFCFLFVLYSVGSFLRSRKREFGMLLLHGMTVKQLRKMVFTENMLVGLGALGAGILAGLLTAKLFLMAGANLLGIEELAFHISPWSVLLTLAAFLLLFLSISSFTTMLLGSTRLIDLFQSGAKREGQPRFSKGLSLLAATLLIASYALAVTASASTVKLRVVPVTLMTMLGTYLFFSQAGLAVIHLLKRNLARYWHRTNLILISNLSYRLKENAWMFFLVAMISTITFCAVGVFASVNRLSAEFDRDHPAEIGYVAKPGSNVSAGHLRQIREELAARGLAYHEEETNLLLADIASTTLAGAPDQLALLSFSDYTRLVAAAGMTTREEPPNAGGALVLMSSQREKLLLQERKPASYSLGAGGIRLDEEGVTQHVPLSDYLTPELGDFRGGNFSGLVVSDATWEKLAPNFGRAVYTAFYTDAGLEATVDIAKNLTENGKMKYETGLDYAMAVSGTLFEVQRTTYGALLFFALLVGTVFFMSAGSFLYFRLYSDLDYDRRQYAALTKLGVTRKEMERIVTAQLGLMFFLPVGVALVHSIFAFIALQSYLFIPIAWEACLILFSFCFVQGMYFYFIRARYLRNLQKGFL